MINLIPPAAKKSIKGEYIKRVLTVWLLLFSAAFGILAVFLLPTFVALRSEISVLEQTAQAGQARVSQYDVTATELITANTQATLLLERATSSAPSEVINTLITLAGPRVSLTNFQFTNLATAGKITLSGIASTRQDLAVFRDGVSSDERFSAVDLPISNLIKDKDLLFTMNISFATSTL
ncbi:MAG: hypothetical protein V4668_04670 [Patescibacteria group bacterium]